MATIPASENEYPEVLLVEGAAPAAPATGLVKAYAKADGLLYSKDDAGAETALGAGAHAADTTDAHDASAISVDPTGLSVITGTDAQTAFGELDAAVGAGGISATIIDAAGDLIVGTAADTAGRLATPTVDGQALLRVSGSPAWALPHGHEFDYVEITSAVNITATSEATANTIVTGNAVTYDGSTIIIVEYWFPYWAAIASAVRDHQLALYDGSSSIGTFGLYSTPSSASNQRVPSVHGRRRLTPSAAAHTYSIRGFVSTSGTASVGAGAGGSGNHMPGFIRITKA